MKTRKKPKHKKLPDLHILNDLLDYDPITGLLTYQDSGEKEAGYLDDRGYRCIRINKQVYKVHRICFFIHHRRDPGKLVIDHINGIKNDNTIFNLRAVKHRENIKNTAASRAKGIIPKLEPGVHRLLAAPV